MDVVSNEISSVLEQYTRTEEAETTGSNELGKDEFLQLLVTQMENQNPLEPQDNGEFIAQLAQFSSLEGIDNLNATMEGFVSSYQSNLALEATALVGRQVQVRTDSSWMTEGDPFTGVIEVPSATSTLTVSIYDASGQVVKNMDLGVQAEGEVGFTWDGTNNSGEALASGMYTVSAEAQIDGESQQLETLLGANVNSVTLGATSSETSLNLEGIGRVALSEVQTIQ